MSDKAQAGAPRAPGKLGKSLFTIAFMFIVTVVFISALSLIYVVTRDTIRLNESLVLRRAVLYAAGLPIPESGVEANQLYEDRVREVTDEEGTIKYYEILGPDGQFQSYVLPVAGAGLWGEIESVVGVQEDLRTLTGIEFVKQSETPGLGARITEDWFKEQFRGKRWPLTVVPEGEATGTEEFQAITGATNTVNGVRGILNTRLAEAEKAIQGR
ncbi:MAG: FMN-binding protein [Spirochaetales bacterium]|nr:FMN-binding protein [Spirochaetales bacterium]